MRIAVPGVRRGGVELVAHEAVFARQHGADARGRRPHQLHSRAERPARHLQRADQHGEHGARPAGVVAAPAVVDALSEQDGNRPERQRLAFDLDGLADAGVGDIFVGNAPDGLRRHLAFGFGPLRRVLRDQVQHELEGRFRRHSLMVPARVVGPEFVAVDLVGAFHGGVADFGVVGLGRAVGGIPDQRLAVRIAYEKAVGADQIGRVRAVLEKRHVADFRPAALVHDPVDQGEQEGGVGLRLDRHPLGRGRRRDRHVRLDMDALGAARPGVGLAPDADHAGLGFGVRPAVQDEVHIGRIRCHDEGAVPQFAVEMLGVVALHALAGAETLVDRPPGRHEGRESAHILHRRAAAAGRGREARMAVLVDQPLGPHLAELLADDAEGLLPGDRHEARIFVPPLVRVGPLHRLLDPVRIVGLLDQAERLDADPAAAGMLLRDVEIGFQPFRHAVAHGHLRKIGAGDALIAVEGNFLDVVCGGAGFGHDRYPVGMIGRCKNSTLCRACLNLRRGVPFSSPDGRPASPCR